MRSILLAVGFMCTVSATAQYNLDEYVEFAKPKIKTIGGTISIGLASSPTHPRLFAWCEAAVNVRYVEVAIGALPGISQDGLHVFKTHVGYRFLLGKLVTVTPHVGYWTHWNGEDKIRWTGGNRMMYGVSIEKQVHNNLSVITTWDDFRGGRYNAMKIGTFGIKYKF